MTFCCFSDDFNRLFFVSITRNLFFKCKIRIMIKMIINVNIFAGFQLTVFENKRTFVKKICTAYNHSDALQSETLFTRSIL